MHVATPIDWKPFLKRHKSNTRSDIVSLKRGCIILQSYLHGSTGRHCCPDQIPCSMSPVASITSPGMGSGCPVAVGCQICRHQQDGHGYPIDKKKTPKAFVLR